MRTLSPSPFRIRVESLNTLPYGNCLRSLLKWVAQPFPSSHPPLPHCTSPLLPSCCPSIPLNSSARSIFKLLYACHCYLVDPIPLQINAFENRSTALPQLDGSFLRSCHRASIVLFRAGVLRGEVGWWFPSSESVLTVSDGEVSMASTSRGRAGCWRLLSGFPRTKQCVKLGSRSQDWYKTSSLHGLTKCKIFYSHSFSNSLHSHGIFNVVETRQFCVECGVLEYIIILLNHALFGF